MSVSNQTYQSGWFKTILIFLSVLSVCYVLSLMSESAREVSNSRRATSAPTASPTVAAPIDDPTAWARYAAEKNLIKKMSLEDVALSTLGGNTYLSIACNMDVMRDGDTYIIEAAKFIACVIPIIRDIQGFDHVTFLFYGPFIDKYGNEVHELGMRAMYSRKTLNKVNAEYFEDYAVVEPRGIFKAADTYMIHRAYDK